MLGQQGCWDTGDAGTAGMLLAAQGCAGGCRGAASPKGARPVRSEEGKIRAWEGRIRLASTPSHGFPLASQQKCSRGRRRCELPSPPGWERVLGRALGQGGDDVAETFFIKHPLKAKAARFEPPCPMPLLTPAYYCL